MIISGSLQSPNGEEGRVGLAVPMKALFPKAMTPGWSHIARGAGKKLGEIGKIIDCFSRFDPTRDVVCHVRSSSGTRSTKMRDFNSNIGISQGSHLHSEFCVLYY